MKVLDLFSGIGGFSIGLERAGMETVEFCEQNLFCQVELKKRWPNVLIHDDVRYVSSYSGGRGIDVICGGFPCQNISVAGKKEGIRGKESGLWSEFKRIIGEFRPKHCIIENVAALRGNGLITVLQDLREVGYDAEWAVIAASEVGAPHPRERIFIVAYPNCNPGWKVGSDVLCPKDSEEALHDHLIECVSGGPRLGVQKIIQDYWGEIIANCSFTGIEKMREGEIIPLNPERRSGNNDNLGNPGGENIEALGHSEGERLEEKRGAAGGREEKGQPVAVGRPTATLSENYWEAHEPPIPGVDDGFPGGLDGHPHARRLQAAYNLYYQERVKALGNSLVVPIAELIGKRIMDYERSQNR